MSRRAWMISWGILAVACIALGLAGIQYGLGFLAGGLTGLLLYKRNELYWSSVLKTGHAQTGTGFFHFLVNYGLMAGILVVAALFPDYLNIFTAAAGMMIIKYASVAEMLYETR